MVYDVSRRDTFDNLTKWCNQIEQNCPEDTVKILIGNKCDLRPESVFTRIEDFVSTDEGRKFAEEMNFAFNEFSLRNLEPIEQTFQYIFNSCRELMNDRCKR